MKRLDRTLVVKQRAACGPLNLPAPPLVRMGQMQGLGLGLMDVLATASFLCLLERGWHWLRTGLRSGRVAWELPSSQI